MKKVIKNKKIISILPTCLVLIIGCWFYFQPVKEDEEESQTAEVLKQQELLNVEDINKEIKLAIKKVNNQNKGKVSLKKRFQNCVVIGDSIGEGLKLYKVIDSKNAQCKMGKSLVSSDDLFSSTVKIQPDIVFIEFGMNDMINYGKKVEKFIEQLKKRIDYLQKEISDVRICVNGVLPAQEKAIKKKPSLKNYNTYNKEIKKLCEEYQLTFVDMEGIMKEAGGKLYEPDGIHPKPSFYRFWVEGMLDAVDL